MKKTKMTKNRKLVIETSKIRNLTAQQLDVVAGGTLGVPSIVCYPFGGGC